MEYVRRLMQAVRLAPSDEQSAWQSGHPPAFAGERASIAPSRTDGGGGNVVVFEPSSKLTEFRLLVGIMSDSSFRAPRGFDPKNRPVVTVSGRPAPNVGIYMTVVDKEVKSRKNYKHFSVGVNTCLGLQIVVAAAITAIGAGNGARSAVVVFGAINTIIAGFLTYLKGSGLPNRLKYFQHEWDKVREYIEARERDLMCSDDAFNIYEQVDVIRQMYEAVKADVESNTPDRFVSAGGLRSLPETTAIRPALSGGKASPPNGESGPNGGLSRMTSSVNAYLGGLRNGAQAEVEHVADAEKEGMARAVGKGHDVGVRFLEQAIGLKSKVDDKIKEIGDLEKQIESHGQQVLKHKEDEARSKAAEAEALRLDLMARSSRIVTDHAGEIERLQKEIEDRSRSIADLRASQLSDSTTQVTTSRPYDELSIPPDVIETGEAATSAGAKS